MAKIDCSKMQMPTEAGIRTACKIFDRENFEIEQTLKQLFSERPASADLSYVLLKVAALNSLYSTQIPAHSGTIPNVVDVAQHIHKHAEKIDTGLAAGSAEIVETIACVSVPGKKDRKYFSFATKYCSWHRPELYPIWDANVQTYLECLQQRGGFAEGFNVSAEFWTYEKFREAMNVLRARYGLGSTTFKDIDKFLWSEGERLRDSGAQI